MSDSSKHNNEEGGNQVQDPNVQMKPIFPKTIVPEIVERLYGLKVTSIKELPSYDDLNFYVHVSDTWDNSNIVDVCKTGYVLKVLNHLQSAQPESIEAQLALCERVRSHGIPTQVPAVNKQGNLWSLETYTESGNNYGPYIIRLVTFLPGSIFANTPYIPGSFYNVGKFVGKLRQAMEGFNHSFYDDYNFLWSLTQLSAIRDFFSAVTNPDDLRVVEEVVTAYESQIVPRYSAFTKGIIHGDVNEQNLIMTECPQQENVPVDQRVHDVAALLDFSDVTKSYVVMDLAICIAYMSIDCPDDGQLDAGGHILAGYLKVCSLKDIEFQSLRTMVCARLCQSLVYGAHSYAQQPGNTYLLTTAKRGWGLLHKLWKISDEKLYARWQQVRDSYDK